MGKAIIIETMALFNKGEFENSVESLLEETAAIGEDGQELVDTPIVFDMKDVLAVNKSGHIGYSTFDFCGGSRYSVKIGWEEAKELFRKSREDG